MAVFGNNTQTNVKAVTEQVDKEVVRMKLNDGVTPAGKVATVSQNLGSLDYQNYDAQKVMNVIEALIPCLSKSVHSVEHVRTTTLID